MATIVILNGPPGVGKDTLARLLAAKRNQFYGRNCAKVMEFKAPMFALAKTAAGLTQAEWDYCYRRDQKERAQPQLGGLSARQYMIKISEEWIKPVFGNQHFGKLAKASIKEAEWQIEHFYFSDGGFIDELIPLCDEHTVYVVRLHSDGYSYEGDSRSYLTDDQLADAGVTDWLDMTLTRGAPISDADTILKRIDGHIRLRYAKAGII